MQTPSRTFQVIDNNGIEHEIFMEEYLPRYFDVYLDGAKVYFPGSYLSFDVAFRFFCSNKNMRPVQSGRIQDGSDGDNAQKKTTRPEDMESPQIKALNRTTGNEPAETSSERPSPSDYVSTLAVLHDLLEKGAISSSEFDTLKARIIAFFPEKN